MVIGRSKWEVKVMSGGRNTGQLHGEPLPALKVN
jgi:hypothetical protein